MIVQAHPDSEAIWAVRVTVVLPVPFLLAGAEQVERPKP